MTMRHLISLFYIPPPSYEKENSDKHVIVVYGADAEIEKKGGSCSCNHIKHQADQFQLGAIVHGNTYHKDQICKVLSVGVATD